MTPEEKIAALVEHIKKEFPKGCRGIQDCADCPLNNSLNATMESDVCDLLAELEYRVA